MATQLAQLWPQRARISSQTQALWRSETAADVADAATNRRDRAPMSEATYSSWMQLVVRVAETVWCPHGDSARTPVPTAHAKCPSSAPALAPTSHAESAAEKGIEPAHVVVWSWYRLGLVVCLTNGL